jgi:hypothetical protein
MLKRWVCSKRESTGDYPLAQGAALELQAIWRRAQKDAGQLELVEVSREG